MQLTDVNSVIFAGTAQTADAVAEWIDRNVPTEATLAQLKSTTHNILIAYKSALIWNPEFKPARYDPRGEHDRALVTHLMGKTAYSGEQIRDVLYALEQLASTGQVAYEDYDPVGTVVDQEILERHEERVEAIDNGNGNGSGLGLGILLVGGALLALAMFGRRRKHR